MPTKRLILAIVALLIAACEPGAPAQPMTTLTTQPREATTTPPPTQRIAVTTPEGDIVVFGVDGSEQLRLEANGGSFMQPTWYGSSVLLASASDGSGHRLTAFDVPSGSARWDAPMASPPFFFLPSHPGGDFASTSLRNDPAGDGLVAELVDDSGVVTELSGESPFYSSWSPDGSDLAIHAGGTHLDIRSSAGTSTVVSPSGVFQAPVWLDAGVLTMRTVEGSQRLSVWSDGVFTDLGQVDGPVRFVARGTSVAIQSVPDDAGGVQAALRIEAIPAGRLVVIDIVDGSFTTVTTELAPVFQWDPTGEKLLFATFVDGSSLDLSWHVWEGGTTTERGTYATQEAWFRAVAPFFDQYAQSLSLWSSDGRSFVVPAEVEGQPVVVVVRDGDGDPVVIEGATWASFAPGD